MNASRPEVVAQAAELADRIRATNSRSSFGAAVHNFLHLMRTVPDFAVGEISEASIDALTKTAERVIDAIEDRLATADDSREMQLDLAKTIYAIREALEGIDRWHRHYGPA